MKAVVRSINVVFLGLAVIAFGGIAAMAQTMGQRPGQMDPNQNGQGQMGQMGSSQPEMNAQMSDDTFLIETARGNMAEVELGQLAEQKSNNPEVKKFAERMVADHTKAGEELKQVASNKGVKLPQALNKKEEATKEKLAGLSGAQFDRAYMKDMVKDHADDVDEFQRESQNGQDPAVKNFAAQTLPTVESHLREAKTIEPQVKQER
jgi:putative membrane protein